MIWIFLCLLEMNSRVNLKIMYDWVQAMKEAVEAANVEKIWRLLKSDGMNQAATEQGYAAKKAALLHDIPVLKGIACFYDIFKANSAAREAALNAWGDPLERNNTIQIASFDWYGGAPCWSKASKALESNLKRFGKGSEGLKHSLFLYLDNFDAIFDEIYKANIEDTSPMPKNPFETLETWKSFRKQYFDALDAESRKFLPWIDVFNILMIRSKDIVLIWHKMHEDKIFPNEIIDLICKIYVELPNILPRCCMLHNGATDDHDLRQPKSKKRRICAIQ